jgi:hypothetical protein
VELFGDAVGFFGFAGTSVGVSRFVESARSDNSIVVE